MPARSQFSSPASSCGHGELFPGAAPYPQVGPGGGFLLPSHFAEDQEPKLSAPVCLCEPRSWKPVPKRDQSLEGRKAAQLSVSLPAEEAGSHLFGASPYRRARPGSHLPARPSATSEVGADTLGPRGLISCTDRVLASSLVHAWYAQCLCWPGETQPRWNSHCQTKKQEIVTARMREEPESQEAVRKYLS